MDRTASADLQGKAETYLLKHLQPLHGDLHATVQELLGLVLDDQDNPLKDLFQASITGASQQDVASNTTSPHKVRKSRLSLRPFRSKESSRPDVPVVAESSKKTGSRALPFAVEGRSDTFTTITEEKSSIKTLETHLGKPSDNDAAQASVDEPKYNCIFCEDDYAYKGTCKRHLEQVHVARAYFKCRGCGKRFKTQPEAKKHCAGCGHGFTKVEPEPKKLYSSEFTRQRFATQQQYVDHLLDLCRKPKGQRPERSSHLKLRNLLELPVLDGAVRRMSLQLYNDAEAWRNVRWDYDRVTSAVRDLENGILDVPLDPVNDLLCLHRAENFASELLAAGRLQSSGKHPQSQQEEQQQGPSSSMAAQQRFMVESAFPSQSPDPGMVMYEDDCYPVQQMLSSDSSLNMDGVSGVRDLSTPGDAKGKRPLSETSRTMQQRIPAGPSRPDTSGMSDSDHTNLDFTLPTSFTTSSSNAFLGNGTWQVSELPPPYQPAWSSNFDTTPNQPLLLAGPREQDSLSYLPQQSLTREMTQTSSNFFVDNMMAFNLDTTRTLAQPSLQPSQQQQQQQQHQHQHQRQQLYPQQQGGQTRPDVNLSHTSTAGLGLEQQQVLHPSQWWPAF